jgi:hypothetical protein
VTGAGSRTELGHAAPAAESQLELERRQQRLFERLDDEGLDAFFCPSSSDLEYLVGFARKKAAFGLVEYQRVEDVFVCEEGGGRRLNRCPLDLVVV